MPAETRSALIAQTPLGRAASPEDIASSAVFIASPAAGWVTGQVLQVSGGFLL
jgi:3-oxoacyl-[acyl-carrier protein] reductase